MGANWIHGIDRNPIFNLCTQHHMLPPAYQGRQLGRKMMFLRESGDPVSVKTVQEVDMLYGMLMGQCEEFYQDHRPTEVENDSVGGFCAREFDHRFEHCTADDYHVRKMIFEQRLLGECIIAGCNSMHEVSLSEIGAFEELPGVHYVIPPGFEAVIDLLKQDIPVEQLKLEHAVTNINWNHADAATSDEDTATDGAAAPHNSNAKHYPVCVECQNGQRFYADHVIVTCSLGYLKKHQQRLFSPALPPFKRDAVNSVNIGTVNKVILEFEEKVLPDEVFRLELVWDRENIENEDLSTSWVKKIGSMEVIRENGQVLVGEFLLPPRHIFRFRCFKDIAS